MLELDVVSAVFEQCDSQPLDGLSRFHLNAVSLAGLLATYTRGAWMGFAAGVLALLPVSRQSIAPTAYVKCGELQAAFWLVEISIPGHNA